MPFAYSKIPHVRKHGPHGYDRYQAYKPWLRDEFSFRCVYCLERERWDRNGHAAFGVDHVKPKGKDEYAHLICNYESLVYSCNRCNTAKSDELILDPCSVAFAEHLRVNSDGVIGGLTTEGKDLIDILLLDLEGPTVVRLNYLRLATLYQRYPNDPELTALYLHAFGFPDDLPDLTRMRGKNAKREGIDESYHRQREEGWLPATY